MTVNETSGLEVPGLNVFKNRLTNNRMKKKIELILDKTFKKKYRNIEYSYNEGFKNMILNCLI